MESEMPRQNALPAVCKRHDDSIDLGVKDGPLRRQDFKAQMHHQLLSSPS
jgi:hypothetical protein